MTSSAHEYSGQDVLSFDKPTTVVVAGKPRPNLMHVDPGVEAAWRFADRVAASKPYDFMEPHIVREEAPAEGVAR